VLQPIKERYAGRFRIAPFSVLLDAPQAPALWTGRTEGPPSPSRFPADVAYIYRKQLEEADLLVLNKADLLTPAELAELDRRLDREFPRTPRMAISALRGDGVGAWLDWVLEDRPAGRTIAEVDYDQYAAGEAALGWLNAAVRLEGEATADWGSFCLVLLDALKSEFRARSAEIAHLKLHLITPACSLTANLTGNQAEPSLRVADGSSTSEVRLVLNARAHIGPEALEALVRGCLASMACGKIRIVVEDLRAFSPARPQPTHRYRAVTP
jgi:hypothetical protein